jgi:hypothetical protein
VVVFDKFFVYAM